MIDEPTTPAEWLEHQDEVLGNFEEYDRSAVRDGESSRETQGYFITYAGASSRMYNSPMFSLKSLGIGCNTCEDTRYSDPERVRLEHPTSRKYATHGCKCGNVAYASMDCDKHPLPSLESRWIQFESVGGFCNHCDKELPQEGWVPEAKSYCDEKCLNARLEYVNKLRATWTH